MLESGSSCKFEQWESSRLSAAAGEQCSTENKLKAARFLLAMAYFTSKRWIVLPGGPLGPLCPLIPVPGAPRSPLSPGKPTETLKSRTHFQTNENKFSYLAKRRNVQGVYETQLRWLLIKVFAWNCEKTTELVSHLFLLDFQVNQGFQWNQFGQAVRALRGIPCCQEGPEAQVVQECCYDIRKESGWAACRLCSSDLQTKRTHQRDLGQKYHLR